MAKLRVEQLAQTLNTALSPVYLISGDETLLVQEAADTIRQHVKSKGFLEHERHYGDKQFDWSLLLASANSLSLFNEQKLIELRIESGKPGDKGSKAIVEYLKAPSDDNVLLIITPKLDGSSQRAKWVKAIEKQGVWAPIWPVGPAQLPRWLGQRLQQAGLKSDSAAIDILAARTEGNLLAAAQEIEKLRLLAPDGWVSSELMASTVADSARFDVFGLIDKALMGDARSASHTLQGLKGEGTDGTVILWALAREIRTLINVRHATDQGQNFAWAAKNAGVWDKRKPLIQNALKRFQGRQLESLLRQANGIDQAIKGLRKTDPWNDLLDLVLRLSGVQSISQQNQRLSLN